MASEEEAVDEAAVFEEIVIENEEVIDDKEEVSVEEPAAIPDTARHRVLQRCMAFTADLRQWAETIVLVGVDPVLVSKTPSSPVVSSQTLLHQTERPSTVRTIGSRRWRPHADLSWPLDDGAELGIVPRQHDPKVVEEMVVALAGAPTAEETAPDALAHASVGGGDEFHPAGERRTPADELVNDGDDSTLGMHKGTEREDVFAKDGSLPDPECKGADQGFEHQLVRYTVSRRLALRRCSRRETTNEHVGGFITCRHLCGTMHAPLTEVCEHPSLAVAYATASAPPAGTFATPVTECAHLPLPMQRLITEIKYVAPSPAGINAQHQLQLTGYDAHPLLPSPARRLTPVSLITWPHLMPALAAAPVTRAERPPLPEQRLLRLR